MKINFTPLDFFIAVKLLAERSYIAVLLIFYDSKRSIGFLVLSFFYMTYYLFTRRFDLKVKINKIVV